MSLETEREQYISNLVTKLAKGDGQTLEQLDDYLMWGFYVQDVFSQFGLGYLGSVLRQSRTNVLMTVKATENGVPLVAFISSGTTIGCIEQMFDLLWAGRLKWQKDKYPWV